MDPSGADPYAAYTTALLLDGLGQTTLGPKTYAYSNLGVGLLGVALARCAGEPSWEALIASRVTGPLGLKGTSVKRALATGGHDVNMAPAGPWGFDALAGAGALRSDAADLALLLQRAMAGGDDVAARMIARSVTPLIDGPVKVGMGWHHGLGASAPLASAVWHNGMTGGWSSFIAYMPGERRGVVILSNAASPVIDLVAPEALRVLAGEQAALKLPGAVKLDAAARARLVGRYQLAPQATLIVTARGEELWAELTGQPAFRVWPESATRVNYRVVEATLEFTLPDAGPASALTLLQGGQQLPAPRVGEP
jgi:CubicO group peptidase (beta-lactamase class C family)